MPTSFAGFASIFAAIAFCLAGFCRSAAAQGATYRIVAFTGQTAPGGGTFYNFGLPRIGAEGTVGFVNVDSRGAGNTYKIFAGLPGALRLVVSEADKVPGLSGGTFQDFQDVSVSKDGLVAFNAGASSNGYIKGIWAESPQGLVLGAYAATGEPSGHDISALGAVGFRSGLLGAKGQESPGTTFDALFFGAAGSLNDVLKQNQVLDGKLLQTIYDTSVAADSVGTGVDVNESGSVALKIIATPSATPSPKETIYVGSPAAPKAIAAQGDVPPGLENTSYQHLSDKPTIAANGLVAFSSTLSSGSGPGSAIFAGTPTAVSPLVFQGAVVPTTTDVTFGPLADAVVNSTGDVVFRATIDYPGQITREGIWIKRKTGPSVLLAVSGIQLPTPSGMREVESVDFAGPGTFNDLHEFVFWAQFVGGDQGIYVADTRPGAPAIHIARPVKPRDYVTQDTKIVVAGTAADDTGVAKVEYTVAREVSASKRHGNKRGKKLVVSRTKLAKGGESWNFKVPLSMGLNLISIVATDELGNQSEPYKVRILRYKCGAN